jgi:hypothetical protein
VFRVSCSHIYVQLLIEFCNFISYIFILQLIFNLHYVGMANLEVIDPVIDAKHRSHLVDGQLPPVLRLRTHDECWRLDPCWIPRYDKSVHSF